MKKDVTFYIRPNILALEAYSTARDEYKGEMGIFLDANENPFDNGVNRYPDPMQKKMKALLSRIKAVPVENIFVGNGSDEAIDLCFRVFCEPGKSSAVAICPSYGMYKVAAAMNDIEMREVLLNEDFSLPVEKLLSAVDESTRLMFVCSPNNPTSNAFEISEIRMLAERFDGILVVDEAYIDFSSKGSMLSCLEQYPNVIVLQTLSKARAMAGLRTGLAFASQTIISYFNRVKYPYNVNVLAQQKAEELLQNDISAQISVILSERNRLSEALSACPDVIKVYPSDANFLLVKVKDARALYKKLLESEAKVIVRDRSSQRLCAGCLRITVGTPEENDKLLEMMQK